MKENRLGTAPVGRLLLSMSLPITISMLIQALYNIVDSMYVAHLSQDALTSVTLAFPIQNLFIAVAVGTGTGMNTLVSRRLGEHRPEEANQGALHGLLLLALSSIPFVLFGLLGVRGFYETQTTSATVIQGGIDYLTPVSCLCTFVFLQVFSEKALQSTGRATLSMVTQGVGALVNIILDPIMIFGYLGVPAMGIAGAAYATIIGQICGAVVGLIINHTLNHDIELHPSRFSFSWDIVKHIYAVGIPSSVTMAITSISTYLINGILGALSPVAVVTYGIFFRIQSFVFMPIFGVTSGMVPIISYNYGARRLDRMEETMKWATLVSWVISIGGTLLFTMAPEFILSFFDPDEALLAMGTTALKTLGLAFIFSGPEITASSIFLGLGRAMFSLAGTVTRQLIFLVPIMALLAKTTGLSGVWYGLVITEGLSFLIYGGLFLFIMRQVRRELKEA